MSLDVERRSLPNQQRTRTELNKEAFENVLEKTNIVLEKDFNVVIDCGLTQDRISAIENLATDKNATVYRFLLNAPYEVLLERVQFRDSSKGKTTDEARFEEVFHIVHSKDFDGFQIIETDSSTPEEIATKIIALLV